MIRMMLVLWKGKSPAVVPTPVDGRWITRWTTTLRDGDVPGAPLSSRANRVIAPTPARPHRGRGCGKEFEAGQILSRAVDESSTARAGNGGTR